MDAAFLWLMVFVGSQLLLIALGLLPQSMWRSFRKSGDDTSRPAAMPPALSA
jgi:hypothetical protein